MKLVKGSLIVLLFFCFSATSVTAAEPVIKNGSFEDKVVVTIVRDVGEKIDVYPGAGGYDGWVLEVPLETAAWDALPGPDPLKGEIPAEGTLVDHKWNRAISMLPGHPLFPRTFKKSAGNYAAVFANNWQDSFRMSQKITIPTVTQPDAKIKINWEMAFANANGYLDVPSYNADQNMKVQLLDVDGITVKKVLFETVASTPDEVSEMKTYPAAGSVDEDITAFAGQDVILAICICGNRGWIAASLDNFRVVVEGDSAPDPEICGDKIDNDGDTLVDCDDTEDCSNHATCLPEGNCTDGIDNDGDTMTDCFDVEDCGSDPTCIPEANCTDGVDNDLDGDFDCIDSDCSTLEVCQEPAPEPEPAPTAELTRAQLQQQIKQIEQDIRQARRDADQTLRDVRSEYREALSELRGKGNRVAREEARQAYNAEVKTVNRELHKTIKDLQAQIKGLERQIKQLRKDKKNDWKNSWLEWGKSKWNSMRR
jgi:hypothetical protein